MPTPDIDPRSILGGMLAELLIRLGKVREFRRARALTRAQLEALKLEKFRRLARHANEHSRYYRRIIAERRIDLAQCVPTDFPVLHKSMLMAHFDDIVTVPEITKQSIAEFLTRSKDPSELFRGQYHVIHTSGSSGEVGYFIYSPRDWARGTGWRPQPGPRPPRKRKGKMRLAYYGAIDGHYAGATLMSSFQRGIARLLVDIRLLEVNRPLPEVIEALNEFQPEFLAGYTTAIKILAEKQRGGALRLEYLTGIATAGEATSDADRAFLQQTFGCALINTYACSEHLGMGGSTPASPNIVLYDDDLIFEFFPDYALVTNLFNETLPLIRYRMADILRPIDSSTHAPYLTIESLVGRNELQPTFKNRDGIEDFISPHTINEVFVAGLMRFQMQLLGEDSFRFMVCLDEALTDAQRAAAIEGVDRRLREILTGKKMSNVRFEICPVDDLPVNPRTRKFQLIVDKRASA